MFQSTGQELADNLRTAMSSALHYYHKINGVLPDRIILYRDGVGDGQASIFYHLVPNGNINLSWSKLLYCIFVLV